MNPSDVDEPEDMQFWAYYRATHEESIEQRHQEFVGKMLQTDGPLSFSHLKKIPSAPDIGDKLATVYRVRYPAPGMKGFGTYLFRGSNYLTEDTASLDDDFILRLTTKKRFPIFPIW